MALTYGFYSSINHDRTYTAEQMSTIFNGIIKDGVFQNIGTYMAVVENSGMTVNIGIGRAWFNGTWSLNDSLYPITLEAAPVVSGFKRIDAVCLKVDKSDSGRANSFVILKGTETSQTPSKPSMPDTVNTFYHALAYITVEYGATSITQSKIQNVVGTSETPFVTGLLETAQLDNLLLQWQAQWNEWLTYHTTKGESDWNTWYTTQTTTGSTSWNNWYSNQTSAGETAWNNWYDSTTSTGSTAWSNWFESIQGQLSEDAATNLQAQIDRIGNIYVQDNVLYMPNSRASVTTDGTFVVGDYKSEE